MDLKCLFETVKPYIDQFNATDLVFERTAKLPSGAYVKDADILKQIDDEDASLVESYNDDRDKEVVTSLIKFFKGYNDMRVKSVKRIVKILESYGFNDLIMLTCEDDSKYLSAPSYDNGALNISTSRLTDGMFDGCPYTLGFLRCTNDFDDIIKYPFDIKFMLYAHQESSDEGYQMSPDVVKQCPKFEPISIVDPEFETKLHDNFKKVYEFIMHDIDAFFKKNAELHEELKKQIIDYVNSPDTGLEALAYLKEVIDEELS